MIFKDWLEQHGCQVEVTQEDDGSGYVCLSVELPAEDGEWRGPVIDITVSSS